MNQTTLSLPTNPPAESHPLVKTLTIRNTGAQSFSLLVTVGFNSGAVFFAPMTDSPLSDRPAFVWIAFSLDCLGLSYPLKHEQRISNFKYLQLKEPVNPKALSVVILLTL